VRVLGALDDAARERLLNGVEIDGQKAAFLSIGNAVGEGVNQWYRVVIAEGRNREVRKLFDAVGLTVNRLIRVRYGAIVLPHGLKRGVWVELGESDVRAVKALAGMDRQEFGQGQGQGQGRQGKGQNKAQQGGKGKGGRGPQQQGGQPQGRGPQQQGNGRGDFAPRQRPQDADRAPARHDADEDMDHIGPIPNPLEQTFDRRFAKGSKRITAGFGRPDQDQWRQDNQGGGKQKGPRQPDPMQTSVGYIGADAFFGKSGGGGGRRGGGGGSGGGGGRGRR
jgi:23S rRNA pseudouridine2605 synthase